jgi:ABC-type polysaccharide/polyol phosphate transport system ATPase subunit
MDEGIGAGDARFAERATKRMEEFIGRSRIVVLASHSNQLIKSMCNKAALMDSGRVIATGDVDDILAQYDVFVHAR